MASVKPSIAFGTVIILFLQLNSLALRNYVVVIDEIKCTSHNNYIESYSCTIGNTSEYPVMNFDVQMKKETQRSFIDLAAYWKTPSRGASRIFLANRIDYCGFKRGGDFAPVFKSFFDMLSKAGTFPDSCPVAANFRYRLINLTVDTEHFPLYVPKVGVIVNVNFYNREELTLSVKTSGRVVYKRDNKIKKNRKTF